MASKQKQKQENKFITFLKNFWVYILAGILVVAIVITLGVMAAVKQNQNVVDVINPIENEQPQDNDKDNNDNQEENNNDKENENQDEQKQDEPVATEPVTFAMPMNNASVIVDYTDTKLVYNPTLDRWESHYYIDMTSSDLSVYSVLDGEVLSVGYDYLTGYVVKIGHDDGLVSVYASLADGIDLKTGDKITKGQRLGQASSMAASSSKYGDHLEFTLIKDGEKVDPNNYLDLQNK